MSDFMAKIKNRGRVGRPQMCAEPKGSLSKDAGGRGKVVVKKTSKRIAGDAFLSDISRDLCWSLSISVHN